jgi:hypothetical protein
VRDPLRTDFHNDGPERLMVVFGFVGIAAVAFAAGWLLGTTLVQWKWFGAYGSTRRGCQRDAGIVGHV